MQALSLRPFVGAFDYRVSLDFYGRLGFHPLRIDDRLTLFRCGEGVGFYLQDYYEKNWVENTMLFLEVNDLEATHATYRDLDLPGTFPGVRLSDIQRNDWGREFFLHDPAGVLWHVGTFVI